MKYSIICLFLIGLCIALKDVQARSLRYKAELKKVTRDNCSYEYLSEWDYSVKMKEDNTAIVNGWAKLIKDIPDYTKAKVTGYQRNLDGSWQTFPSFTYESDEMCKMMEKDERGMYSQILKHSNLPEKCPVKSGHYKVENFHVGENWPEDVSGDWWKFRTQLTINGTAAVTIETEVLFNKEKAAPGTKPNVLTKHYGAR